MEFLKNIYYNALQICVTNAIGTAVASKDATVFYCLPNTTPNELKSFIFEQEAKARLCFIVAKDWDQILDTLKGLDNVQLSGLVSEILNYNRFKSSSLGYADKPQPHPEIQRNIAV